MKKLEKERIAIKTGLSSQEALKKLKKHGLNELGPEKKLSILKVFLNQFRSPFIYILFFAGLVTLLLKEWTDSVVIFLAVFANTFLGLFQEFKAEKSLIALKKILVPHALVIRDGKEQQIEAKHLVPGDLVVLKTGDKIPADGQVTKAVDLHVNEAVLTGESEAVAKKREEEAYMGTVIISGRGQMLVKQIGQATKMGNISLKLGQTLEEETPLKKQIGHFSKLLAIIFSLICLAIFFIGFWHGMDILEVFTLAVAVAVAAIPEGLVVSLTVILTLGMQRILKQKGLVRNLLAAETLGSVNVICADKTGTLTEGKMKVVGWQGVKDRKKIIKSAILCNNMINPLEIAMMNWAAKQVQNQPQYKLYSPEQLNQEYRRLDEVPFSSERKFIAILSSKEKEREVFVSGAPEVIMAMSDLSTQAKLNWQNQLNQLTKKGLRLVAFATFEGEAEKAKAVFDNLKSHFKKSNNLVKNLDQKPRLEFLGFLLFEDPVRKEVGQALRQAKAAGIKIKVITGDYKNTAVAVLNKMAISNQRVKDEEVMEGYELAKISEKELLKKIDKIVLFCRTTPEQKIRIVEALQAKNYSVAMMGDGVNDALALKKADIGIVVGSASEVAKETADMVLLDSNFNTIISAIEEGRGIFENIRKVVLFLLSDSFTEVILIGGSFLLGLPVPLLPAQILWVNLVEDGLPGLALAFEPKDKDLMKQPPRAKNSPLLDKEMKTIIFVIGIVADLLLFAVFYYLLHLKMPMAIVRTIIFATLAIDSLLYIFSCKTLKQNIWQENIFSNKFLLFSVATGIVLLLLGIYHPFLNLILKTESLPLFFWPFIILKGLITVSGIEFIKWLFLRKKKSDIVNL